MEAAAVPAGELRQRLARIGVKDSIHELSGESHKYSIILMWKESFFF